ncbi:hypothetical protein LCGC14_0577550 [marine sediment metagenome]|uniref:Uncharacterized protein n=1 Tax=marine sediment metagenome TaxID=412755 RepID=A0A0F9S0Z1_9ZZZZ
MQLVEVMGPVQRFNGHVWEDIEYTVPIEVAVIGDLLGWTFASVTGDVPVRWLATDPSVRILSTEAVAL